MSPVLYSTEAINYFMHLFVYLVPSEMIETKNINYLM